MPRPEMWKWRRNVTARLQASPALPSHGFGRRRFGAAVGDALRRLTSRYTADAVFTVFVALWRFQHSREPFVRHSLQRQLRQ